MFVFTALLKRFNKNFRTSYVMDFIETEVFPLLGVWTISQFKSEDGVRRGVTLALLKQFGHIQRFCYRRGQKRVNFFASFIPSFFTIINIFSQTFETLR